jgi:DeoR/GlpR family transcriptional regulator of sugar metabolism
MTMQELLDRTFGRAAAPREPQRPTDMTLARERELAEQARKIEELRKARIAREAANSAASD